MKLGVLKTIQREELSKYEALPKWMEPFLQVLNQFIGAVGLALKGNLTFEDNFLCKIKKLTFTHDVEQEINPESKIKVVGVLPQYAGGLMVIGFQWTYKTNGNIGVKFQFAGGTEAVCSVIILLG
jgi:hypothetical protein